MSDFVKEEAEKKVEKVEKEAGEDGDDGDDGDDGAVPEEDSTATFTPIVKLEEIEVKTHEEDENIVWTDRCAVYIYGESLLNKGTGVKEWIERGKGDLKILKHKETSKCRVIVRTEKIFKIICNHYIDPKYTITAMASNDKAVTWVAANDFADGVAAERYFCIRFKNPEICKAFKDCFETSQKENEALQSGSDSATGAEAADEAATAIASLSTKEAAEA